MYLPVQCSIPNTNIDYDFINIKTIYILLCTEWSEIIVGEIINIRNSYNLLTWEYEMSTMLKKFTLISDHSLRIAYNLNNTFMQKTYTL